jgi:hypothetical protein
MKMVPWRFAVPDRGGVDVQHLNTHIRNSLSRIAVIEDNVNNFVWDDITDFTGSNLTDIATRSHTSLTDIGTNTHAAIDSFISLMTGTIVMYGGATAPSGWVLCDGTSYARVGTYASLYAVVGTTFGSVDADHFNVPDMRGIFARGAGASGKLTNANSVAFSGTLGTYQNDELQGFGLFGQYSNLASPLNANNYIQNNKVHPGFADGGSGVTPLNISGMLISDGNGTPRTGTETNPANLSLTYIIKV